MLLMSMVQAAYAAEHCHQSNSIWQPTATRLKGVQAIQASPAIEVCKSPALSVVGSSTMNLTDHLQIGFANSTCGTDCNSLPPANEAVPKPGMGWRGEPRMRWPYRGHRLTVAA